MKSLHAHLPVAGLAVRLRADGMAAGLPLNRKRSERAAKVSLKHHEGEVLPRLRRSVRKTCRRGCLG